MLFAGVLAWGELHQASSRSPPQLPNTSPTEDSVRTVHYPPVTPLLCKHTHTHAPQVLIISLLKSAAIWTWIMACCVANVFEGVYKGNDLSSTQEMESVPAWLNVRFVFVELHFDACSKLVAYNSKDELHCILTQSHFVYTKPNLTEKAPVLFANMVVQIVNPTDKCHPKPFAMLNILYGPSVSESVSLPLHFSPHKMILPGRFFHSLSQCPLHFPCCLRGLHRSRLSAWMSLFALLC